jgi:hypothetical protein
MDTPTNILLQEGGESEKAVESAGENRAGMEYSGVPRVFAPQDIRPTPPTKLHAATRSSPVK